MLQSTLNEFESLAAPLRNADIIRVHAEAPRFVKTVTLRGNVATPGRLRGRRYAVRDLIPNKESLLTPDYWLRREQLGLPVADFQPMLPPVRPEYSSTQPGQTIIHPAIPENAQTINSGLFPGLTAGVPNDTATPSGNTAQFSRLLPQAKTQPNRRMDNPGRWRRFRGRTGNPWFRPAPGDGPAFSHRNTSGQNIPGH